MLIGLADRLKTPRYSILLSILKSEKCSYAI